MIYLVAPTYQRKEQEIHRKGFLYSTGGDSVKYEDSNLRVYALLKDTCIEQGYKLGDTYWTGDGDCYIWVSGEMLRILVSQAKEVNIKMVADVATTKAAGHVCLLIPVIDGDTTWEHGMAHPVHHLKIQVSQHTTFIVRIEGGSLTFESAQEYISACGPDKEKQEKQTKKENIMFNTNNLFKNLYFGKAPHEFALSFNNQITYKGKYYENGAIVDALGLTLDFDGLLYIMPVQKLEKGDIVITPTDACYYDGAKYISLTTGEISEYAPIKVLNMTFYSVVKNLAGNMFAQGKTDAANPFGNMLPFLLLGRDNDSDDLVKFMLLSQGGFNLFGAAPEAKK